ncbi:MAG: endonuclease V [Candidatus Bathyarchaeia archaeon]
MDIRIFKDNFSIEKARKAQSLLSRQIIFRDMLPKEIRYVAGVDVAYSDEFAFGAVAVLEYSTLNLIESQTTIYKITFPYIPTLLSFRELPPAVLCIRKLKIQPDVFLVDGHGFAHPYRCGFASHLGVVLKKPTIGVAKSRLIGGIEYPEDKDFAYLKHNGELIGAVLKKMQSQRPVYISVGHMVSLETAVKIVKHCARHSNIPEPLIKAHQLAAKARNQMYRLKNL